MPTLTNYQTYKVNAYAVLSLPQGPTQIELIKFSSNWSINSIPEATASVALGRDTVTGIISAIHIAVDQLTSAVDVEVYVKVTPGPNSYGFSFESWPSDYFLAFFGKITSTDYSRSRDSVYFNIRMVHWLDDLQSSSMLTQTTHSLTPNQLNGLAGMRFGQGLDGGGNPAFLPTGLAAQFFTLNNIDTDLWSLGIGPWLKELCQQDILSDDDDVNLAHNIEGLDALSRFEPFVYATGALPNGRYSFGTPLALPIENLAGAESLSIAISEAIGQETFAELSGMTLWHKLVANYAALFDFRIIPLVSSALVVPQIAGQRTPWQIIYGQEYSAIGGGSQAARPVKGVRVLTGLGSPLGVMRPGEAGQQQQLSGRYDNPDLQDGTIIYQNAPSWSSNMVAPAMFGQPAAAPFNIRGNGIFPGLGVPPPVNPVEVMAGAATLWDAYARSVYINAALRGRTTSIQGKLRFDIAPGSTVQVRCIEDKFVQNQLIGQNDNALYAEVQAVGINIDAENMSASTTFQLANTRTFAENTRDSTSLVKHPLYDNQWSGAPLAEEQEFIPRPNPVFT